MGCIPHFEGKITVFGDSLLRISRLKISPRPYTKIFPPCFMTFLGRLGHENQDPSRIIWIELIPQPPR